MLHTALSVLAMGLAACAAKRPVLYPNAHAQRVGDVRRLVEAVPEWPLDSGLRARLLLYVALPLGSWLGGALVELLLDAALS